MAAAAAPRSSSIEDFIVAGESTITGERPGSNQLLHTQWRLENEKSILRGPECTYIPLELPLTRDPLAHYPSRQDSRYPFLPVSERGRTLFCSELTGPKHDLQPMNSLTRALSVQIKHAMAGEFPLHVWNDDRHGKRVWNGLFSLSIWGWWISFSRDSSPAEQSQRSICDAWALR